MGILKTNSGNNVSKNTPNDPLREPKGTEVGPRVIEWSPKSAQRVAQNGKKLPKIPQRAPWEGPKNNAKKGTPNSLDIFWNLMPLCSGIYVFKD